MKSAGYLELLSTEEFAKRLAVSRTTIFQWKKTGKLSPGVHFIQIDRTVRFIWEPNTIRSLHDNNAQKSGTIEQQSIKPTKTRKHPNIKSAINLNY